MRTTLTLDDDVFAHLSRFQASGQLSLKEAINQLLREGLTVWEAKKRSGRKTHFETDSVSMGRSLIGSLDNIGDVLALVEGENHR